MKIATERNKIVNISPTRRPICLKQMGAIFETDPKIWSAPAGENVPNGRTHAIKKTWHDFLDRCSVGHAN